MVHYDYLIVGGGMAADAAARGIRELDGHGSIGILSADTFQPYARPALTKKLWTDPDFSWQDDFLGTSDATGADIRLGTTVTEINRGTSQVLTDDGSAVGYGRLLLTPGARPRRLDGSVDDGHGTGDGITYFRGAAHYRQLRPLARPGKRMLVIGGGYIGAELAAGMIQQGALVELVHPDEVLGASQFPPDLARRYEDLFIEAGVDLISGSQVRTSRVDPFGTVAVTLDGGIKLLADAAVAGLGVVPATELAENAGLDVDDGIVVDARLRTSDPNIWAAGDAASYPDRILGRTRVEHVDSAQHMGRAAGRSMAGSTDPYTYTPYMYSQVFGVRWEAIGRLDTSLPIQQVDLDDDRSVAYYLQDRHPVGVLLWQLPDHLDAARAVLAAAPTDPDEIATAIT